MAELRKDGKHSFVFQIHPPLMDFCRGLEFPIPFVGSPRVSKKGSSEVSDWDVDATTWHFQ